MADKLGNLQNFGYLLFKAFYEPDFAALKDILTKIALSLPLSLCVNNERAFLLALKILLDFANFYRVDFERDIDYLVGGRAQAGGFGFISQTE
ncbi:MAG: hypothetical protein LBR11_06085 [Deltaproteobacteria bacterium]|nr:hypothetical protein [Deltaproteobacteria bacterium]